MPTRTGNFAIGLRRVGSEWSKDIRKLAAWARESGFDAIDLGRATRDEIGAMQSAGLRLGTVNLWLKYTSANAAERQKSIKEAIDCIKEQAALGARIFFTVIGSDAAQKRSEAYALAVESLSAIAQAAEQVGAHIAIEGWPGGGTLPNLGCNPETCRALIKDTNPRVVGLNYDPSHLIRMGIDHVRFLREFAPYVKHVHGKDTEVLTEAVYEYGLYQQAIFAKPHGYGEFAWRYTIPGHGQARWTEILRILEAARFAGIVSVELEDGNFNGAEAGEKAGFQHSLAFLRSA